MSPPLLSFDVDGNGLLSMDLITNVDRIVIIIFNNNNNNNNTNNNNKKLKFEYAEQMSCP